MSDLIKRIHDAVEAFFGTDPFPPPPAPAPRPVYNAEQIVERMAAQKQMTDLNWRTSVVDLLKVLGEDPSDEHRAKLAEELGYGQPTDNPADRDVWLHGKIMQEIAEHGSAV